MFEKNPSLLWGKHDIWGWNCYNLSLKSFKKNWHSKLTCNDDVHLPARK